MSDNVIQGPADAPGTGTPEAGVGYELLSVLAANKRDTTSTAPDTAADIAVDAPTLS